MVRRTTTGRPAAAPADSKTKAEPDATPAAQMFPAMDAMMSLARQFRGWQESMSAIAGPATDLAFASASAQARDPAERERILAAGAQLRQMREAAGLTIKDVSKALDLNDPALLESAERGSVSLPYDLLLRLAAVVGRDDPASAMLNLTRAYNPSLWASLEQLGFGKLVIQAARERELANLYRANDAARALDDADFARILEFTRQAFDMAVAFRTDDAAKNRA